MVLIDESEWPIEPTGRSNWLVVETVIMRILRTYRSEPCRLDALALCANTPHGDAGWNWGKRSGRCKIPIPVPNTATCDSYGKIFYLHVRREHSVVSTRSGRLFQQYLSNVGVVRVKTSLTNFAIISKDLRVDNDYIGRKPLIKVCGRDQSRGLPYSIWTRLPRILYEVLRSTNPFEVRIINLI